MSSRNTTRYGKNLRLYSRKIYNYTLVIEKFGMESPE